MIFVAFHAKDETEMQSAMMDDFLLIHFIEETSFSAL